MGMWGQTGVVASVGWDSCGHRSWGHPSLDGFWTLSGSGFYIGGIQANMVFVFVQAPTLLSSGSLQICECRSKMLCWMCVLWRCSQFLSDSQRKSETMRVQSIPKINLDFTRRTQKSWKLKNKIRGREHSFVGKMLLYKHEDLSDVTGTHIQKLSKGHTCPPRAGKGRQASPLSSLTS